MGGAFDRLALACIVVGAVAGCDSHAKASDPQSARPEAKSKEYESCAASMQCQDELRCFDGMCRRTSRSAVGDFFAALGAASKARGDLDVAIDAYTKALGHYDSEKIALPPDIDCAFGSALAAAKTNKEHAELGARVLHRCMLAVPVGSSLRRQALADLAGLADVGLEPLTLGRTQLADAYLTHAPQKPSTDKLQVTITPTPPVDKKTFPLVVQRLSDPDMKTAFIACWDAYNAASKKDTMTVSFGLKWSYYQNPDYEDEPGRFSGKLDPAVPMPLGPEATADQCVRAAVEPALKALNTVTDAFATKLTITVK
jgi:hypothetical protein